MPEAGPLRALVIRPSLGCFQVVFGTQVKRYCAKLLQGRYGPVANFLQLLKRPFRLRKVIAVQFLYQRLDALPVGSATGRSQFLFKERNTFLGAGRQSPYPCGGAETVIIEQFFPKADLVPFQSAIPAGFSFRPS